MAVDEISVCVKCNSSSTCLKRGTCAVGQCISGYCSPNVGGGTIDPSNPQPWCPDGASYDSTLKKCVCNIAASTGTCSNSSGNAWNFFNRNGDHCTCETADCPSGQYPTGFSIDTGEVICVACPTAEADLSNVNCTIGSSRADSNYPLNMVGIDKEYNGCYLPANCRATDSTGTFTVSDKCKHLKEDSSIIVRPNI